MVDETKARGGRTWSFTEMSSKESHVDFDDFQGPYVPVNAPIVLQRLLSGFSLQGAVEEAVRYPRRSSTFRRKAQGRSLDEVYWACFASCCVSKF